MIKVFAYRLADAVAACNMTIDEFPEVEECITPTKGNENVPVGMQKRNEKSPR